MPKLCLGKIFVLQSQLQKRRNKNGLGYKILADCLGNLDFLSYWFWVLELGVVLPNLMDSRPHKSAGIMHTGLWVCKLQSSKRQNKPLYFWLPAGPPVSGETSNQLSSEDCEEEPASAGTHSPRHLYMSQGILWFPELSGPLFFPLAGGTIENWREVEGLFCLLFLRDLHFHNLS